MIVDRFTKSLLLVIAACLIVLCARSLYAPANTVHGATADLQFSADKDRFYFYDPGTHTVYAYPANGGHPQSAVQLLRPGGELKPAPTY